MVDKTILVVVDPTSDEQPAVEHAAWLARCLSVRLELFICDYDPDIAADRTSTVWLPQPARETLLGIHRERLDALAAPLREAGLDVSVDVGWDHPLEDGIVHKVLKSKPWMVAKDTHHHNVLRRTLLSNTDWHLIRECPAPLYLVKPKAVAEKPKVFAAIDPMHEHDKPASLDHKIFDLAEILASRLAGELHAVHTYVGPASMAMPDGAAGIDLAEATEAVEQEHRLAFAEFLKTHELAESNAHLLEGHAHLRLPEITEQQDAGMIVMGAVSRRGLNRIFLGSTAERVLDRMPCDLLIVKPEGFRPSSEQ